MRQVFKINEDFSISVIEFNSQEDESEDEIQPKMDPVSVTCLLNKVLYKYIFKHVKVMHIPIWYILILVQ